MATSTPSAFSTTLTDVTFSTTPVCLSGADAGQEHAAVRQLLKPRSRKAQLAEQRLRAMAILDRAIKGEQGQPTESELRTLAKAVKSGTDWLDLFPGVAAVNITVDGSGPTLSLRLTKQEGVPVRVTRDGEAGDAVIAIRRVNDTDIYTLGRNDLATKLKISQFEASALIELLEVQADPECYKVIRIGSQAHKRYSMKALDVLAKARAAGRIGEAVKHMKARRTGRVENRVAVR